MFPFVLSIQCFLQSLWGLQGVTPHTTSQVALLRENTLNFFRISLGKLGAWEVTKKLN